MLNEYDKIILSTISQNHIREYTGLEYHEAAESLRERHGYSSGMRGGEFIPLNPLYYMYDNQLKNIANSVEYEHLSKKGLKKRLEEVKSHFYGMYQLLHKTINFYQTKIDELRKENLLLKEKLCIYELNNSHFIQSTSNPFVSLSYSKYDGSMVMLRGQTLEEIKHKLEQLDN